MPPAGSNKKIDFSRVFRILKIAAGAAVTLAVLFAAVWIIDYAVRRQSAPKKVPAVLFGAARESGERPAVERGTASDASGSQTFFETLLNEKSEKKELVQQHEERLLDRVKRRRRPEPEPEPEPAAEIPVLEPAAAQAGSPVYTVQLGSFQQAEGARQFSENLAAKGYEPYIMRMPLQGRGTVYRVRIGRFATREEAKSLASKIEKTEKITAFITSK